ncbi:hypothetical protein HNQ81_002901 [Desulfoprunum benzoelyticum]|uniref:Uncharacterized protein n=1 Tax=Desulfoprunum benzoelyticum TaxID=1506996 RepID=A0A840V5G0_9BACT|nr:hypothetical protein [Desulfoprunum benzoelyticum]
MQFYIKPCKIVSFEMIEVQPVVMNWRNFTHWPLSA